MYVANNDVIHDITMNKTGCGKFNITMSFYDSPSFIKPVLDSPYYVELRQNLYLQVNLHSSDTDLVLFVDTCTASPHKFKWAAKSYDLIKDG